MATRKALALLDAGARVHVVALGAATELEHAAEDDDRLTVTRAAYSPSHIGDAHARRRRDRRPGAERGDRSRRARKGRLVNVVDAPAAGNCTTPAVLRSGNLVVSVTAGGVPAAAKRIRDALAAKLDDRYASAVAHLAALRRAMLDDGRRDRWTEASNALVGDDFCEQVESGTFDERVARMALTVVGVNHRGASLDIRERLCVPLQRGRSRRSTALREASAAREAVLLSTCNRTEVYLVEEERGRAAGRLGRVLRDGSARDASEFGYVRRDRDAVDASLPRRERSRFDGARRGADPRTGARRVGGVPLPLGPGAQSSLSDVAARRGTRAERDVDRARRRVGELGGRAAREADLRLAARKARDGPRRRRDGRAGARVPGGPGRARGDRRQPHVRAGDGACRPLWRGRRCTTTSVGRRSPTSTCWSARRRRREPWCSSEHVRPALAARGDRPLCILDIALPRDVDPAVRRLENVFLYDLDDLQAVVSANVERRRAEMPTRRAR